MNLVSRKWNALMSWTPSREAAERVEWIAGVCERVLKVALVLTALFLASEIAVAFLPGGAVERVLNGGR